MSVINQWHLLIRGSSIPWAEMLSWYQWEWETRCLEMSLKGVWEKLNIVIKVLQMWKKENNWKQIWVVFFTNPHGKILVQIINYVILHAMFLTAWSELPKMIPPFELKPHPSTLVWQYDKKWWNIFHTFMPQLKIYEQIDSTWRLNK